MTISTHDTVTSLHFFQTYFPRFIMDLNCVDILYVIIFNNYK